MTHAEAVRFRARWIPRTLCKGEVVAIAEFGVEWTVYRCSRCGEQFASPTARETVTKAKEEPDVNGA